MDEALIADVKKAVNDRKAAVAALAALLVQTPSDLPDHPELATVEALRAQAAHLGLPAGTIIAQRAERPNLVIDVPCGRDGPRLLMTGHTDTKPPGPRGAWSLDPWSGAISDGRLWGLGSADMKAALAAMLHATDIVRTLARPARGGVVLAFTADEESNGELGLKHVLDTNDLGVTAALIGEPAGIREPFDQVGLASRGFAGFRLRVRGTPRHSGLTDEVTTINPILKLCELVLAVRRLRPLQDFGHPRFPHGATLNVATSIEGGVAAGVVPEWVEATGDIRLLPGMQPETALGALRDAVAKQMEIDPDLHAEVVRDGDDWPGAEIAPDHPLVAALLAAGSSSLGRPISPGGFPGATEAHLLIERGIATVPAVGPGVLTAAHAPNESVALDAVVAATAMYALAALEYLDGSSLSVESRLPHG
jgi:acetylornithine deacetylase/succinyl-diaminopimelate desuccinylase-like protein